jgi:hypothetical protein
MASYENWNSAISSYFLAGQPQNSPVFLCLDNDAVDEIAVSFLNEEIANPVEDFVAAVKDRCVLTADRISLGYFHKDIDGIPGGIGFLGLLVMAAYSMKEEEGINELNYFLRLREILHLPRQPGRPDGMPAGSEESLWNSWNHYLKRLGFRPTAERSSGPQTYIHYALSQAILRDSDKQFLNQKFGENSTLRFDYCEQLGFWLTRQQIPRRHLHEGLHHSDPGRVWEFYRAAYRFYEEGTSTNSGFKSISKKRTRSRDIESGIFRKETASGRTLYLIFPRQPERSRSLELRVSSGNDRGIELLCPLKEGF